MVYDTWLWCIIVFSFLQNLQTSGNAEADEKVAVLNTRITEMLENIEKLGGEGEVEQAQSLMKLCDQLKEEREQLQNQKGGVKNFQPYSW